MRLSGLAPYRVRRRGTSLVSACCLAAALTLVLGIAAAACGTTAATPTTKAPSVKGPSTEGPYPYAYPATGNLKAGTGTTISGTTCTPSTSQFPGAYAAPCVPKFTGNNGGATYNGVTSTTITLAQIEYPTSANEQELEAEAAEAGDAPQATTSQVEQVFLNYFNKVYASTVVTS